MSSPQPNHPGRPVGITMLVICCVIGMAMLTLLFDGLLEQRQNPNRDPDSQIGADGSISVTLQRNPQGHYVVNGYIDGEEAVFLLDTGATDVVLPEQLASAAGVERGYATRAATANGELTVYSAIIEQLQIADITLSGVRASINPAMYGNTVLLGMSALRHIEFTQRGNTLTLHYMP